MSLDHLICPAFQFRYVLSLALLVDKEGLLATSNLTCPHAFLQSLLLLLSQGNIPHPN